MAVLTRRRFLSVLGLAGFATAFSDIGEGLAARLSSPVLSASVEGNSVTLGWTDAGDELKYIVYRGVSPTSLTPIATLPANTLTYTDVMT